MNIMTTTSFKQEKQYTMHQALLMSTYIMAANPLMKPTDLDATLLDDHNACHHEPQQPQSATTGLSQPRTAVTIAT